jgi:hypothetical protein
MLWKGCQGRSTAGGSSEEHSTLDFRHQLANTGFDLAQELPTELQPLPVFKVLYRNINRIQEHGGRKGEVLHPAAAAPLPEGRAGAEALREAVRNKDVNTAEQTFAALAARSTGKDQAHTLLRQSVRYCVRAENWNHKGAYDEPRTLLPKVLDEHKLLDSAPGERKREDAWLDELSQTIFKSSPQQAAAAVAAALAEGIAPADVGEAITLAANQLILRDMGRPPHDEVKGKPVGSVHGDSIGVHACDSANAWRNPARVGNPRNCIASLILGAYQVAFDRIDRGGDFLHWQPLPVAGQVESITASDPADLLREADEAIRGNLQARASAIVYRYG